MSTSLMAKLLRDVLRTETFESMGEVKHALVRRCQQLRIHVDQAACDAAIDLVATNHPIVTGRPRRQRP